jgi:hypothetical protein
VLDARDRLHEERIDLVPLPMAERRLVVAEEEVEGPPRRGDDEADYGLELAVHRAEERLRREEVELDERARFRVRVRQSSIDQTSVGERSLGGKPLEG